MNKKIISCVLLIALIAIPLTGCARGKIPENLPPIADFTYSPSAPTTADNVIFIDKSTDADGNIVSWAWDFGDGDTSTLQNSSHRYCEEGEYHPYLIATDDDGASDTHTVTITVSLPPPTVPLPPAVEIGKDEAIRELMGEIIKPASSDERISAFMLSQPLQKGDVVTSESGEEYPIDDNTWFIFIDYDPEAYFAHATGYVFKDAKTGDYEIIDETWPPLINNVPMWHTENLGRGHLIEIYPILDSSVPISGVVSTAPSGDYGDAPDGQDAYHGVQGCFPTLFNTTNSKFARPGGHTLNIGEEMLGLNVSAEVDANDPNDPDGVPNLVDADSDERIYVIVEGKKAKLAFTVTVSPGAPDVTRYANAVIDFDQSGNWSAGLYGTEWVVVNLEVDVDPGSSETVITSWFSWGSKVVLPSPVWIRLSLTREKVSQSLFSNVGGWDGSGQFEYGEIEDYLVFLTDCPPSPDAPPWWGWWPPWPGFPPGGQPPEKKQPKPEPPKAPPPGPEDRCGETINYYYLIINCGDDYKTKHMKPECDHTEKLFKDQNYTSGEYLKPDDGTNTRTNIEAKLKALKGKVKCLDRIIIVIKGHGNGKTISLYNKSGGKIGSITPKQINDWLDIDQCRDEECKTKGKCCFVSIVISSCHAQAFLDGLKRLGRTVAVSSTTGVSWGGAGGYTAGFIKDMRSKDSDTDPKDGCVTVKEGHKTAAANQKNKHPKADADISDQQCDCICPCKPGIDGDKWVWDDLFGRWVDEIDALPGQPVRFKLEIENDGECRDIVDLEMIDFLPYCLSYGDEAIIYYDGVEYGPRPPDEIKEGEYGLQLVWDLEEIEALEPGESITIEYVAYAEYPGENINLLFSSAHCAYDYSVVVTDEDVATVIVFPPEIPPEEVLYVGFETYYECNYYDMECVSCTLTISFWAEDLTGGVYPVTNVILNINGVPWFDSEPISTVYYENSVGMQAGCGQTIHIELIAMNLIGLEAIATKSITTPS